MLKREMNIADYDAELWQAMEQEKVRYSKWLQEYLNPGKSTSGRAHRTDRLRKLHQPARNAGAGFSADQQIC